MTRRLYVPAPPGEESIDITDAFPPELAELIAGNMQRMFEIAYHSDLTEKVVRDEYKRLANEVVDATSNFLRSAGCDMSQDKKDQLIAFGQQLRLDVEKLP